MPGLAVTLEDVHDWLDPERVCFYWLVVTVVGLSYLALVRWRARNRSGRPVCAACGYIATGLTTRTCPECGGDLTGAGVVRPGWRRPTELPARLVQWTILLPLVGMGASWVISKYVPYREVRRSVAITFVSEPDWYVYAVGEGGSYGELVPMRSIKVEVTSFPDTRAPIQSARLSVSGEEPGYRYNDATGKTANGAGLPDGPAILRWLGDSGIDVTGPGASEPASDVAGLIAAFAAGSDFTPAPERFKVHSNDTYISRRTAGPLFRIAAVAFWSVAWLAGVVWLRRHRPRPEAEM